MIANPLTSQICGTTHWCPLPRNNVAVFAPSARLLKHVECSSATHWFLPSFIVGWRSSLDSLLVWISARERLLTKSVSELGGKKLSTSVYRWVFVFPCLTPRTLLYSLLCVWFKPRNAVCVREREWWARRSLGSANLLLGICFNLSVVTAHKNPGQLALCVCQETLLV